MFTIHTEGCGRQFMLAARSQRSLYDNALTSTPVVCEPRAKMIIWGILRLQRLKQSVVAPYAATHLTQAPNVS